MTREQRFSFAPFHFHRFTEHGAIMAATVLNSPRAIEMSVFVVRAFVQMRQALIANQHVLLKLSELEERLDSHDAEIQDIVEAVRELIAPLPLTIGASGSRLLHNPVKKNPNHAKTRKA